MGISYTRDDHRWLSNQQEVTLTASFDASYTTGGEALNPDDAGLGRIENVDIESITTDSGYVVEWDDDAGTLVVREESDTGGGLTEVAAGTDLSTESIRLSVRGRS